MNIVNREIKVKCIDDYLDGMMNKEVAIKYNVGTTTLSVWFRVFGCAYQSGVKNQKQAIAEKKQRLKMIRHDYRNGVPIESICSKYNINEAYIMKICYDIEAAKKHKNTEKEEIIINSKPSNFERDIRKTITMREKIGKLKETIKRGDSIKFETTIDRHTEVTEMTVTQITESNIFGRIPSGRIESVMWNDIHCSKVRLIS
jgi:transposase-like protein